MGRLTVMALIGAMLMAAPAHAETAPPAKAPEGKRLTGKVTPERSSLSGMPTKTALACRRTKLKL